MVAQNILKKFFFVNDYKLEAAVDVNKCLEQVELHKFISHVRSHSELPSSTRTMILPVKL